MMRLPGWLRQRSARSPDIWTTRPDNILDCGCARGTSMVFCIYCDHSRCLDCHDLPHQCPECPRCRIRHGWPICESEAGTR